MDANVESFINQLITAIDKPSGVEQQCKIHITDHAYRWYFALNNSSKTLLHRALESITELNIQYQRKVAMGSFIHIEYVQIIDGLRLMEKHGITPKADEIQVAFRHLDAAKFNVSWWGNTKREITKLWLSDKTFNGMKRSQVNRLLDAMKVVEYISQATDTSPLPDIRTLSATLYGDSKKLENKSFSGLVRKLLLPHIDADVVELVDDGTKLLEYIGISKYPAPIRFKAIGLLQCLGPIDLSALRYGIGVSPDEIKGIEWNKQPSYVLFIENRASFERYVREIDDSGMIIYTAGFPPRSWIKAIEIIISELRSEVPIYHWGDRDAGGYRILAFLAKRLDIDIQPYLMGVDEQVQTLVEAKLEEKPVSDLIKALKSAKHYPAISVLYEELAKLSADKLPWIEQEQIAPVSPLKR